MDYIEELIFKMGFVRFLIIGFFFSGINLIMDAFIKENLHKRLDAAEAEAAQVREVYSENNILKHNRWYDMTDLSDADLRKLSDRVEGEEIRRLKQAEEQA